MDYTVLLTSVITAVATLGASFLANNKISDLKQKKKDKTIESKNDYLLNKARESKRWQDLLDDLREHYGVDRTILYYFHNGQVASNGYSFYKFSCLAESFDKNRFVSKLKDQQGMPIGLMMDFFAYYRDKGMVIYPNTDTVIEGLPNIKDSAHSMNVVSTYSKTFTDLDGVYTCSLVMNMESQPKTIEDFAYFNQIGNILGELLSEKK